MEEQHYRLIRLLQDYFCGRLSAHSEKELNQWIQASPKRRAFFSRFQPEELEKRGAFAREMDVERAFARFKTRIGYRPVVKWRKLCRYAALFIGPAALSLYLLSGPNQETGNGADEMTSEIMPGGYKALLTLADGQTFPLEKKQETRIAAVEAVQIASTGQEIIYTDSTRTILPLEYHSLTTPRGGEYQVTLADGSRIYLNAASALKYPVVFGKEKREVYLSGEAYFEIAKDSLRPFYVIADGVRIRVYGTVFNINTHKKDRIETVLLSGSIGITGEKQSREYFMRPSELAEFTPEGEFTDIRTVDPIPYISWHLGKFIFENKRLEEILEDLALWYNIEVFYTHASLKEQRFTGSMRKYEEIKVILEAIHRITGVNFSIQGKTLMVTQ